MPVSPRRPAPGRFPPLRSPGLALGITAIAAAGLEQRAPYRPRRWSWPGGLGILSFFVMDARNGASRLFPVPPFRPSKHRRLGLADGGGAVRLDLLVLVLRAAAAVCPARFLAGHHRPAHRQRVVAWSSAVDPLCPRAAQHEPLIVRAGALMIVGGLAGFAWAVPAGSIPGMIFFARCKAAALAFSGPSPTAASSRPPGQTSARSPPRPSRRCSAWATRRAARLPASSPMPTAFPAASPRPRQRRRRRRSFSISFRWRCSAASPPSDLTETGRMGLAANHLQLSPGAIHRPALFAVPQHEVPSRFRFAVSFRRSRRSAVPDGAQNALQAASTARLLSCSDHQRMGQRRLRISAQNPMVQVR